MFHNRTGAYSVTACGVRAVDVTLAVSALCSFVSAECAIDRARRYATALNTRTANIDFPVQCVRRAGPTHAHGVLAFDAVEVATVSPLPLALVIRLVCVICFNVCVFTD